MSLKSIKGKIRSVNKTRQVTNAMEAVSAVKMRKSQEQALLARPFALSALKMLKRLSRTVESDEHILMKDRKVKKVLFVVITSDRGLAGGLNSSVIKAVTRLISGRGLNQETVGLLCIGKKGYEYFLKRGYTCIEHTEKDTKDSTLSLESLEHLAMVAGGLFETEEYDEVFVAYTNFVSTLKQDVVVRKMLPIHYDEVQSLIFGIVPVRGKYAHLFAGEEIDDSTQLVDYIYEPSASIVIDSILKYLLSIFLYHSMLEARASEFSARMVAMKSASDKALELSKSLTLQFNKVRQSAITREVSEIIGGMETLATN
jgi:F-type H+-transporting ATPase subunit gamma